MGYLFRSIQVAECLRLLTLDPGVPGSNPAGGGIHLMTVRCFIAQSLSFIPPVHHLNMTYIKLKGM